MTSHMIRAMNVGKLRSLKKKYVSGSLLIYASFALLLCSLIIFSFRDELGLVDSLGVFNNLLNKAGCWVKCSLSTGFSNRDCFILV